MGSHTSFLNFTEDSIKGIHKWGIHTFKVALTDEQPTNDLLYYNTVDFPDPLNMGGTPSGGYATTITVSETGGVVTVQGSKVSFTGITGAIGPFRYAIFYNFSDSNKSLVGWWDYGSNLTINHGDTFDVKFNQTDPGTIFTLT